MINLIVAFDENRVIGKGGKVPWHIPGDLKHFKEQTSNNPVIMGRKTWESIPEKFRPLPGRPNFVVSRTPTISNNPRVLFATSLESAIDMATLLFPGKSVWIIGGAEIYKEALGKNLVDQIVATEVKGEHEGDVFFPAIDELWKQSKTEDHDDFRIVWYSRKAVD